MRFGWAADERRVRRAVAGDRQAAGRLVDDHYPGLVRFLIHLTGRVDEAEEIAQETFVRAWQRLDTYGGRSSFKTWIHRVAYREFLAHRERESPGVPFEEAAGEGGDFADRLLDRLTIERAVLALPLDLRTAFLLLHIEGLTAHEVAEVLGVPRGTVLSRVAAARERLARRLGSIRPEGTPPSPKRPEETNPYEITTLVP